MAHNRERGRRKSPMHQPSCSCGSTSKPPKGQVMGETKRKRPIRNEPLQNLRGGPHEAQEGHI